MVRSSTERREFDFADRMLYRATCALIVGPDDLRERLAAAYATLTRLRPEHLPVPLRESYRELLDRMGVSNGRALNDATDHGLETVAKRLVLLYGDLRRYTWSAEEAVQVVEARVSRIRRGLEGYAGGRHRPRSD